MRSLVTSYPMAIALPAAGRTRRAHQRGGHTPERTPEHWSLPYEISAENDKDEQMASSSLAMFALMLGSPPRSVESFPRV